MESILQLVQGMFGSDTEALMLAVIFASVFLVVGALAVLVMSRSSLQRRLEAGAGQGEQSGDGGQGALSVRYASETSFIDRLVRPLQRRVTPKDEEQISSVRRTLLQAGYLNPHAVQRYFTVRIVMAIALPAAFLVLAPIITRDLKVEAVVLIAAALVVVGLYLPSVWVTQRIQKRQQSAREGFPDSLDMLLVCVEAGLGLNAALNRVGDEIGRAHPVLGEQFNLVGLELRAGKSREMALRNMAERIGIDEVKTLVTLLLQSEALGTSIAQALRVHAEDMRIKRMLRAEEKAHMLPVKLAFPLVLFILPCLIIVIMTPAIIKIIRVLMSTLNK
jgi:tight adherence protein C